MRAVLHPQLLGAKQGFKERFSGRVRKSRKRPSHLESIEYYPLIYPYSIPLFAHSIAFTTLPIFSLLVVERLLALSPQDPLLVKQLAKPVLLSTREEAVEWPVPFSRIILFRSCASVVYNIRIMGTATRVISNTGYSIAKDEVAYSPQSRSTKAERLFPMLYCVVFLSS
ncbi:hypothetical protein BHM03_00007304 [Ensete ventricosum]|nr:hypothetical protein BHM03_00007304 [Ensete ventricosum]